MTKESEYFKKIYCTEVGKNPEHNLPEEGKKVTVGIVYNDAVTNVDSVRHSDDMRIEGKWRLLRLQDRETITYWYKPIPSQPVLSFEEWWDKNKFPIMKISGMEIHARIKAAYLAGCNQPPLEGEVKDEKALKTSLNLFLLWWRSEFEACRNTKDMLKVLDETFEIFKEKFPQIQSPKPVEGDVRESFENLFKRHQEFSIKTFISSTPMSSLEGLKIEADEAIDELGGIDRDYDGEALPLEYVDCLMYLMDSIARAGIPLERIKEMFVKKLAINAERKWKINKNGSYSHI